MKFHRVLEVFSLVLAFGSEGCHRNHSEAQPPPPQRAEVPQPGEGPVGVLTGRVTTPAGPARAALPTSTSVEKVCGSAVPDERLLRGAKGGVENVVVWVESGPVPGPQRVLPSANLDQRGCRYAPPVLAARAGSRVTVVNSDPLIHNVRAEDGHRSLFNFAMPLTGMRVTRLLPPTPGQVQLHCDVHPWMRGVVRTFDHPYFTLSGKEGAFALSGVPAGPRRLHLWHELLGEQVVTVTVPAGGSVVVPEVSFPGPGGVGQK